MRPMVLRTSSTPGQYRAVSHHRIVVFEEAEPVDNVVAQG